MLFAKIKYIVLISFFLVSCGGSDPIEVRSLSDIVGVWEDFDFVDPNQGIVDEYYIVIQSSGVASLYDYAGDTYDNLLDCYVLDDTTTITHIDGNEFNLGGDLIAVSINGNNELVVSGNVLGGAYPAAAVDESHILANICQI